MTAGEYFALVNELPVAERLDITGEAPFIVLSPHPDDESLGAGGLIALARKCGQEVALVLLTDGSKSHPNSLSYPRDRLIATRRSELAEAGRILGLPQGRIFELGLLDGAAPTSGPGFDRAVGQMEKIVRLVKAKTLFVTWEHDPHCDHEAAARLALALRRRRPGLKLWFFPVWGWHLAPSQKVAAPPPAGHRLAIDDVLTLKRSAIFAHVSQTTDLIADDPDGFCFTDRTLAPFLGSYEYFIEAPSQ